MRGRYLRVGFLAATVTLLLTAGCITVNLPGATTPPSTEPTQPTQPTVPTLPTLPVFEPALDGTAWVLESIKTSGNLTPALAIKDVTLVFADNGKVGGSAGCNSYSGSYESTVMGSLSVTDIISTMMLCMQPGLMAQEHDFLDALRYAEEYEVEGGKLRISGGGNLLVLKSS